MTPTTPTITQIAIGPTGNIIGLGNDGLPYYWNTHMNNWTLVEN